MINEYMTVKEISLKVNMTMRNVRKIIASLITEKSELMIHKDKNNSWQVHHLLIPHFQRKRNKKERFYALSIDPSCNHTEKEIDEVLKFALDEIDQIDLEFYYSIEQKVKGGKNHFHCYTNCRQKKKLITALKFGFSKMSYMESVIFDLEGWKNYITKTGTKIKMI